MLRPSAIIVRIGGEALGRAGDLHVEVGLVDGLVELPGGGFGAGRVAGEVGRDLDRHVAVDAVAGVVDRAQERPAPPRCPW